MRAAKAAKEDVNGSCNGSLVDNLLQVALPLLKPIIDELCDQEPQKRGSTLALWLLARCNAPPDLLKGLQTWNANLSIGEGAPPPAAAPQVQASPGVKIKDESPKATIVEEPTAHVQLHPSLQIAAPAGEAPNTGRTTQGKANARRSIMWKNVEKEKTSDSDSDSKEQMVPSTPMKQRGLRRSNSNAAPEISPNGTRKRRFTMAISTMSLDMPPRPECLQILRKVPAFSGVVEEDLHRILDVAVCKKYGADEVISVQGAPADHLHVVLEGCGKLSALSQVGNVESHQFWGDEALKLSACTNPMQVSAWNGPLTTLSISQSAYAALDIKRPGLAKRDKDLKAKKGQTEFDPTANQEATGICSDSRRPIIDGMIPSKEEADIIKLACGNNKILSEVLQLSQEQCNLIAESVYAIQLSKGDILFSKGDHAMAFYVIREGLMDVLLDGKTSQGIHLQSGNSFGELALLYDSPRSATLQAVKECTLWVLARHSFKTVACLTFQQRLKEYSEMLATIPTITQVFDPSNLDVLADVIEEVTVYEGEHLCEKGVDEGLLFIIFSGECEVIDDSGEEKTVLRTLVKGDWIGEQQVVKGTCADVTVDVKSEMVTALVLDDHSLRTAVAALEKLKRKNITGDNHLAKELIADQAMADEVKKVSGHSEAQEQIGRMSRLGTLGEGSFGSVVLLEDSETKKMYALKALSKAHILEEKMGAAVVNEKSVMDVLDSDFIVRLHASYQDENYIFFMLQPVFGGELYDVYTDRGFFGKLDFARFYIGCVTFALEHMHQKRVIYRDLKLENCLVDELGYVKLTDMGIAKVIIGKTYTICGTADYFAPETLRKSGHNRAVDWWAAGVLLFIMAVGRSPFDADDVTQIYKNIVKGFSKVSFPACIPSDLVEVIKSLCRKKPEERVTMQKGGVELFKEMPWFSSLKWPLLAARELEGPFIPGPPDYDKIAAKTLERDFLFSPETILEWDGSLPQG